MNCNKEENEQNLRLICAGCGGHILPETITYMPCFGNEPSGYRHLCYCHNCKRYCCCSIETSGPFSASRCPECNSKLVKTDKMAKIVWNK